MVKIIKKTRKLRMDNVIIMLFMISAIAFFLSVTMLRSYNVVLATQENKVQKVIEKTKNDVAHLELEVKQLDNRDRILEIAKENGLLINQENIVSVVSDTSE